MIELVNVSFKVNEFEILRNINLRIEKSDKIILAGPNGSGKTILCLIISGIIRPTEGEVYLDGEKIEKFEVGRLRRTIGIVFQEPEMQFVTTSVEKEIEFGMENLKFSPEEIKETREYIIERTGLNDIKERTPYEISGGEKQITSIASVLAMKPSFLIFDEVTTFLDLKYRKRIYNIIENINSGFIWVTQNFDEFIIGKKLIMLERGKITLEKNIDEMIQRELFLTSEMIIKKAIRDEGLEKYI